MDLTTSRRPRKPAERRYQFFAEELARRQAAAQRRVERAAARQASAAARRELRATVQACGVRIARPFDDPEVGRQASRAAQRARLERERAARMAV